MHSRCSTLIVAAACLCALGAGRSALAAPPPSIGALTSLARLPDPSETSRLRQFAEYHVRRLASDKPADVSSARNSLSQPLRGLQVSRFFREAYSEVLLPLLGPAIDQAATAQGRMNAVQVVSELGTDRALEVLQRHCHVSQEDDLGIRMWASRGVQAAIDEGRGGVIPDHKLAPAIRALGDAADAETDWRVLQWQFDALASINHPVAQRELDDAFSTALQRLARMDQATPLVKSLGQFSDPKSRPRGPLSTLHGRFLRMPPGAGQRQAGQQLADQLLQVLRIADRHWDGAMADEDLRGAYQRAVRLAEKQLAVVLVTIGRTPPTDVDLERAFADGDRDRYQAQLRRFEAAVPAS